MLYRMRYLPLLALLVSCGCSTPMSTVSGVVTFKGKPIDGGTITFYPFDPESKTGLVAFPIAKDGTYTAEKLNYGEYYVGITNARGDDIIGAIVKRDMADRAVAAENNQPPPPPPEIPESARPSKIVIPEKYLDPVTSGIICTVDKPQMDFPVSME